MEIAKLMCNEALNDWIKINCAGCRRIRENLIWLQNYGNDNNGAKFYSSYLVQNT